MPNNFQPRIKEFQKGERLSAVRLNEIVDAVSRSLWQKQQSDGAAFGVTQPLEIIGKLDEPLPAATDFGETYGEAVMSVWIKNVETGKLFDSGRNETVKQRQTNVSELPEGAEVKARWIEGEWVVDTASGGTGHHIWFETVEVICDADNTMSLKVIPIWYTGGCTTAIPGEDSYGEIDVIDPCSILQLYTAEFLEAGAIGRATYMYPRNGYCEPEWLLDTICGQPECV